MKQRYSARVKVCNLDADWDNFTAWFEDQDGNCYHDHEYTGSYREGSTRTFEYELSYTGRTRVVCGC